MQDLTPIFEALTALAAAVLTAAVIPWVRARLGAERMAELLDWVRIGVAAAEQLYRGGNGSEKKRYVLRFLEERGFSVVNIDATLLAQAPKLAPYKEQMAANLAAALGIEAEQISVKATTEEGLGFTGDSSGMAAHAVVLLEKREGAAAL